jgi:hypothetical protein
MEPEQYTVNDQWVNKQNRNKKFLSQMEMKTELTRTLGTKQMQH